MRIDAHQHFWDPLKFGYPWMPHATPLRRAFLPADLLPILERNRFEGSVVVQATTDPGEAEWLLSLAAENRSVLGVVAWVDLTDPRCGAELERLQKNSAFAGVRHPVHDEPDDRWLLRPAVIQGLRELERRRIPFDLLLKPRHLSLIPELVDCVPSLPMVIDHIAKPLIAQRLTEPWMTDISLVAQIAHIHVKLSGMITEADPQHWSSHDLAPFVQHAWNEFGPDRCVFGSDWPVCLLAGTWKEVLASTTQALGPVRQEARSGFIGDNAARFYRLERRLQARDGC